MTSVGVSSSTPPSARRARLLDVWIGELALWSGGGFFLACLVQLFFTPAAPARDQVFAATMAGANMMAALTAGQRSRMVLGRLSGVALTVGVVSGAGLLWACVTLPSAFGYAAAAAVALLDLVWMLRKAHRVEPAPKWEDVFHG